MACSACGHAPANSMGRDERRGAFSRGSMNEVGLERNVKEINAKGEKAPKIKNITRMALIYGQCHPCYLIVECAVRGKADAATTKARGEARSVEIGKD